MAGPSKKFSCRVCEKNVPKSAHALRCFRCEVWQHAGCGSLLDEDYVFMKNRMKYGFRWICSDCLAAPITVDTVVSLSDVSSLISDSVGELHTKLNERLNALEAKITSLPPTDPSTTQSFANIVKETLEMNKTESGDGKQDMVINAFGEERTVKDSQVLIVKPKPGMPTDIQKRTHASNSVERVLKSIPVESVKETRNGSIIVRFPTEKVKSEANDLMNECFDDSEDYVVAQPKKMLPKMTVTGIPSSFPDSEIIECILNKNKDIRTLVEKGLSLELLFTKAKSVDAHHKVAVLKMAPEIRALVCRNGHIYIGLSRCKAYDRFWVVQCYHCQGYGHLSSECPKKHEDPCCTYCAGSHRSKLCNNKDQPKCINCSRNPTRSCNHYASSSDCPLMVQQRNKVIENTNFMSSKNE